jgi:hypothetical protein
MHEEVVPVQFRHIQDHKAGSEKRSTGPSGRRARDEIQLSNTCARRGRGRRAPRGAVTSRHGWLMVAAVVGPVTCTARLHVLSCLHSREHCSSLHCSLQVDPQCAKAGARYAGAATVHGLHGNSRWWCVSHQRDLRMGFMFRHEAPRAAAPAASPSSSSSCSPSSSASIDIRCAELLT